jgi:hypothetical protein
VFAFDVDDTLEVAGGPVAVDSLRALVAAGHVVGLCGNWAALVRVVPDWHRFVAFLGPFHVTKAEFLIQIRQHVPASGFVLVGNDPETGLGSSEDRAAAQQAGWRFLLEREFAAGQR